MSLHEYNEHEMSWTSNCVYHNHKITKSHNNNLKITWKFKENLVIKIMHVAGDSSVSITETHVRY